MLKKLGNASYLAEKYIANAGSKKQTKNNRDNEETLRL